MDRLRENQLRTGLVSQTPSCPVKIKEFQCSQDKLTANVFFKKCHFLGQTETCMDKYFGFQRFKISLLDSAIFLVDKDTA